MRISNGNKCARVSIDIETLHLACETFDVDEPDYDVESDTAMLDCDDDKLKQVVHGLFLIG